MSLNNIKSRILDNLDHSNFILGLSDDLSRVSFGDYLMSGINTNGDNVIGYVVQIRIGWGAFGSPMFLIRDTEGNLARHENQSFWKLTDEQIDLVKPLLKWTPEEELDKNPNLTYTLGDCKFEETGFIINKDNAPTRVDSCAVAITVTKER